MGGDGGDGDDGDDGDEALLRALSATEAELKLLQHVHDEVLRDKLLFCLLRAPIGEAVHVSVNARIRECHHGCNLQDVLENGEYLAATVTRAVAEADAYSFALRCGAMPTLDQKYVEDDVEDKLLQSFALELIRFLRFPRSNVRFHCECRTFCTLSFCSRCACTPATQNSPVAFHESCREEEPEVEEQERENERNNEREGGEDSQDESSGDGKHVHHSDHAGARTVDPSTPTEQQGAPTIDCEVKVGDRLKLPKNTACAPATASIVNISKKGTTLCVWDDMMWAGFPTQEVELGLRDGTISRVQEEDDVPSRERARALLSPANMAPDCFFFEEQLWSNADAAAGYRWFGVLTPAPEDGTYGQKYSAPRISHVLKAGSCVSLSGRVARLVPISKRTGPRELLCRASTPFTVLGFVQANMPAQRHYWVIVSSKMENGVSDVNLYAATIFGKGPEEVHINVLEAQPELGELRREALDAATQMAKVS